MTTTLHEYGAKAADLALNDSHRVGPDPEDAIREALNLLQVYPIATAMRFNPESQKPRVASGVSVYRIRIGVVLPIGVGDIAERVRAVLNAGFDGWGTPVLPQDPEPLQAREDRLPVKVMNVLLRHQFRFTEEVALVPDDALLELRGMGDKQLNRLREVIPQADSVRNHHRTGVTSIVTEASELQGTNNTQWSGTSSLLRHMGQLTTRLADLEEGAHPAAQERAAEGIAALQAELSTFLANSGPRTSTDGTSTPSAWCGNAAEDGAGSRGWFVGHFLAAVTGPRVSEDVELKWGQHVHGEQRDDWALGDRRTTLTLLVSGGPWYVQLPDSEHTLTHPGDYLLFGPGVAHTWRADGDTIMLTIRWPSRP